MRRIRNHGADGGLELLAQTGKQAMGLSKAVDLSPADAARANDAVIAPKDMGDDDYRELGE